MLIPLGWETAKQWTLRLSSLLLLLVLTLELKTLWHSKSIVTRLPGYPGQLPFKLETGYLGIGENEEVQLFYYFIESERNHEEDPLIFYLTGGPGASAILTFFYQIEWISLLEMANVIFLDILAGTRFSYATTQEAWVSSDSIMAKQANEFLKKFLIDHPNPLYIRGLSLHGKVVPIVTLEVYDANERGDLPTLNIQGYILCCPLTDKFMEFNSRLEYAHRMALISDDIYKTASNCRDNYVDVDTTNALCSNSLQRYEECISGINLEQILEPLCDSNDVKTYC